ncbi:MAG: glycosyltransferase family 4 protein [Planctomycetota bacterium]
MLIIAEACNPDWVSVPLAGWSHYNALRQVVDPHLVTHPRNRGALLNQGLTEGEDFTVINNEHVAKPMHRLASLLRGGKGKGWTTVMALAWPAYWEFERLLWKHFRDDLRAGRFDLVHRLTPLTPTIPSRMATRCRRLGVPFVLGPLNGGVAWPAGFDNLRRKEREWLSYVRGGYRYLPAYRAMGRDAAAIICGSMATLEQMPDYCQDRCHYIPENAVDPERFDRVRTHTAQRPLKLAFLGRLVPYKGADMLIDAVAPLIQAGRATLDIYGDGPERQALSAQVRDLGLSDGVVLHGWIEHQEVSRRLAESDVLASPSVREFGGGVCLEAMAIGLCPVIADYAGPAELVTTRTGIKVAMGGRQELIAGFRQAIERLADDPLQVDAFGRAGRERVHALFTWSRKAQQVTAIYDWVLGRTDDRPMMDRPWDDDAGTVRTPLPLAGPYNQPMLPAPAEPA